MSEQGIPIQDPAPDFHTFVQVLKGEKRPEKVHFVELGIDGEIVQYVLDRYMNRSYVPLTAGTRREHQKQAVDFFHLMGYDYVPVWPGWNNLPTFKERTAEDTAPLSRGERRWVEEGGGIIRTWHDFEKISWESIRPDLQMLECAEECLPEGMQIAVVTTFFEAILELFMGYQDLFVLSYDNPELVEAVFEQVGHKVYTLYQEAVQHPKVGVVFHGDDLGHKTGTLLSPEFLRRNVFPWFKRFASLAHERGKLYWYHSCGNPAGVMEELIEDVKIDAFHSFQDVILPVGQFMKRYGDRIAVLGGVDVDNMARMREPELRRYVRGILKECTPGRYALGSGNSVTNYVPPENYLAMLDEGVRWGRG